MQKFVLPIFSIILVFGVCSSTNGHTTFKKALGKKYPTMKVSCNACHVKSKPKTERNEFGKLFYKEFKDKKITENFKKRSGDERKKYEKDVMVVEFNKALEKIKKMKKKDSEMTYDELIKAGEMPSITPKPSQ